MIAIVYDENSYHSSSSHKSGERYLSFSITIIVDLSLPHYPPPPPLLVEKYTSLSTQTYVSQKWSHVFVNEHKAKKIGREGGYFRNICFGRMVWGRGVFCMI